MKDIDKIWNLPLDRKNLQKKKLSKIYNILSNENDPVIYCIELAEGIT